MWEKIKNTFFFILLAIILFCGVVEVLSNFEALKGHAFQVVFNVSVISLIVVVILLPFVFLIDYIIKKRNK